MPSLVEPSSFLLADRNVLADRLEHRLAGFPPIPAFKRWKIRGWDRPGHVSFRSTKLRRRIGPRDSLASSRRIPCMSVHHRDWQRSRRRSSPLRRTALVTWMADLPDWVRSTATSTGNHRSERTLSPVGPRSLFRMRNAGSPTGVWVPFGVRTTRIRARNWLGCSNACAR